MVTVIQEAWIGGVSTRRADELVQAMGLSGISKSQVSKLCKDIDERVGAFLDRPLDGEWPYLWLDATYLKVRDGGRIVSVAAIIAVAVSSDGRREIVGLGVGPSEAEPFWSGFLKSLVKRGLKGVKLVISDAHDGLRHAITRVLRAAWQRCRAHWMRNALAHVPKGQHTMVAAAIRQAFLQADAEAAHQTTWRQYRRSAARPLAQARRADGRERAQDLVAASLMKRLGEFLIACILLVLTLPLMLIVALTVKWESPGPVVERRERIGTNGRPFQMLSFRTMAQRPGPVHSTWQPTAVGHFLRSTRINALPQLFNVLRGEMGLFETALFD